MTLVNFSAKLLQYTHSSFKAMDSELMYVVVNGEAIMMEHGQLVTYLVDEDDGTIDWTTQDTVDWEDMLPNEYKMYKAAVDFIQTYTFDNVYTK